MMSEFYYNKHENTEDKGDFLIPEDEYKISCVRSSGPGGQNVNKCSTKAILVWDLFSSHFSDEEKARIACKLGKRIKKGILTISDQTTSSQSQNRENVIKKLNNIADDALQIDEERIPTRPSRSSRERRIDDKKIKGKIKDSRKRVEDKDW